jgi:hypothetical protein
VNIEYAHVFDNIPYVPNGPPIPETGYLLDLTATAFTDGALRVKNTLNAALRSPRSTQESKNAVFYQDASAIVNAVNAAAAVAPQILSVAAVGVSTAAVTASRLAVDAASKATDAVNSVKNVNLEDLSVLVARIPVATSAFLNAVTNAKNLCNVIYSRAETTTSTKRLATQEAKARLNEVNLESAKAQCNSVPGSSGSRVAERRNDISITTAKRILEVATASEEEALSAESAIRTVKISLEAAVVQAATTNALANTVNGLFTDAKAKSQALAAATLVYKNTDGTDQIIGNNRPLDFSLATDAYNLKVLADAAAALLPPLNQMNTLVSQTTQSSYLMNLAAANAKTLSKTLDQAAKAAAAPSYNPVTPQMIATQTAAAERFGAAAAAAASRLERISQAPPVPPILPPPGHAPFHVANAPISITGGRKAADERAVRVARGMGIAPRNLYLYKTC